jgi:hypothetical protein
LFLSTLIYFFSSFSQEVPLQAKDKVILIEPIVIPPSIKKSIEEETFLNLKFAVNEASSNDKLSEEEEAMEVLKKLETHLPPITVAPVVVQKKEVVQKKVIAKNKPHPKIKKVIKKEKIKKKKLVIKEKNNIKIVKKKKIEVDVNKKTVFKKEKKIVFLGEHNDLHTLSKEKREHFKHLEIVSESKPFRLDEIEEIKNPLVKTVDVSSETRGSF